MSAGRRRRRRRCTSHPGPAVGNAANPQSRFSTPCPDFLRVHPADAPGGRGRIRGFNVGLPCVMTGPQGVGGPCTQRPRQGPPSLPPRGWPERGSGLRQGQPRPARAPGYALPLVSVARALLLDRGNVQRCLSGSTCQAGRCARWCAVAAQLTVHSGPLGLRDALSCCGRAHDRDCGDCDGGRGRHVGGCGRVAGVRCWVGGEGDDSPAPGVEARPSPVCRKVSGEERVLEGGRPRGYASGRSSRLITV